MWMVMEAVWRAEIAVWRVQGAMWNIQGYCVEGTRCSAEELRSVALCHLLGV